MLQEEQDLAMIDQILQQVPLVRQQQDAVVSAVRRIDSFIKKHKPKPHLEAAAPAEAKKK